MKAEPEQVDAKLHRRRDLVDVLAAGAGRGEEALAQGVFRDDDILRLHRPIPRNNPEAER